ncbi:hypothetical protein AO203_02440 [Lactobacillus gallinarum]|nr:hypothetical protein AO203_02440 [Lactobacillus gallinarum]
MSITIKLIIYTTIKLPYIVPKYIVGDMLPFMKSGYITPKTINNIAKVILNEIILLRLLSSNSVDKVNS